MHYRVQAQSSAFHPSVSSTSRSSRVQQEAPPRIAYISGCCVWSPRLSAALRALGVRARESAAFRRRNIVEFD